jgi:hypothetical protein
LLEACEGLIAYADPSGTVRFVHYAVQKFLQHIYLSHLLSPIDLAKACLTYLTFDVFSTGSCNDLSLPEQRIGVHKFSRYASQFWVHYIHGLGEDFVDVRTYVFNLLRSSQFRNSLLQLQAYPKDFTKDQTPLHILCKGGLVKLCLMVLEKQYGDLTTRIVNDIRWPQGTYEVPSQISGDVTSKDDKGRTALEWTFQSRVDLACCGSRSLSARQ